MRFLKKGLKKIIAVLMVLLKRIEIGQDSYIAVPYHKISGKIHIGHRTTIGKNAWIECFERYKEYHYKPTIKISDNVTIGKYLCLTCIDRVEIGAGSLFSEFVFISDHYHDFVPGETLLVDQQLVSKGPVIIGDNCFIGYRVCILSGVNLGNNCVVGSNSVVTKSFPPYSMIGGVPARLLKTYNQSTKQWD